MSKKNEITELKHSVQMLEAELQGERELVRKHLKTITKLAEDKGHLSAKCDDLRRTVTRQSALLAQVREQNVALRDQVNALRTLLTFEETGDSSRAMQLLENLSGGLR